MERVTARIRPAARIGTRRPAVAAGLRAGVATAVPLAVAYALGVAGANWAGLAGYLATLADKGGSYRMRATSMGLLTGLAAAAAFVATLVGSYEPSAVAATLVVATACGFAGAFGESRTGIGLMTLVVFVSSLAAPGSVASAAERFALVLAGGSWAMLLALLVWPIRPFRPARQAIASVFVALGALADHVAQNVGASPSASDFDEGAPRLTTAVRTAAEAARGVLAATRLGRQGEAGRGENLVVLLEIADQIFSRLVAIRDVALAVPPGEELESAREALSSSLRRCAVVLRELAVDVRRERPEPVSPDVTLHTGLARAEIPRPEAKKVTGRVYLHAVELLDQLRDLVAAARSAVAGAAPFRVEAEDVLGQPRRSFFAPVREHLTTRSVVFRHALRLAVTTATCVFVTHRLDLPKGQWVTISAVVILQPYASATTTKGLQRIGGTLAGGAAAALLAGVAQGPVGLWPLLFALSATAVALLPMNYAIYAAFSTATFVLLAEASAGDWHLAGQRIANNFLGGALALAASWLLWPARERGLFRDAAAEALRAAALYVRSVAEAAAGGSADEPAVAAARRAAALTAVNAEASLQRLLPEFASAPELVEARMAVLACTRQLTAAVTALAFPPAGGDPAARALALAALRDVAEPALEELADATSEGRAPSVDLEHALPRSADEAFRFRVERALGLLRAITRSVGRLADVP